MQKLPRIKDISKRSKEPEILDETAFPLEEIDEIYENINKINRWLGGDAPTLNALKKAVKGRTHVKVIDVGSGGGGMCRNVSDLLAKMKIPHEVIGVDINDDSLAIARERSKDYRNVQFKKVDIFSEEFRNMEADIIISTLTFHHLTNKQIGDVLENCMSHDEIVVIINDLHRSKLAFYLFYIVGAVFSLHFVNRYDGLISILRSFRKPDLKAFENELTHKYPDLKSDISWKWAFRWVWTMNKI